MRTLLIISALVTGMVASSVTAFGAVIVEVDLDRSTAGVQSTVDVINGATIEGAVRMQITGDSQFTAYDFILAFDSSRFSFGPNTLNGFTTDTNGNRNVAVDTNRVNLGASGLISLSPFSAFDLGPLTDDDPLTGAGNMISGIAAGNLSGTPAQAQADGTPFDSEVYLFTLTALQTGPATLDILPATTPFIGNNFDIQNPDSSGDGRLVFSNATAVPEASSLWLITLVGLYLGRRQLCRRRLAA